MNMIRGNEIREQQRTFTADEIVANSRFPWCKVNHEEYKTEPIIKLEPIEEDNIIAKKNLIVVKNAVKYYPFLSKKTIKKKPKVKIKYLTVWELSRKYNVPPPTIMTWVNNGILAYYKSGRTILIHEKYFRNIAKKRKEYYAEN